MAFDNINTGDKIGTSFNKTNNAIDKIVIGGVSNNGVLKLTYNDGSFLDIPLPVVSAGVSILTQSGAVAISGTDPNCFIDVPALEYSYNGDVQSIASTQFAFVAPDPTNDRLDVIYLDPVTNSYGYIQGTPAMSPQLPTLPAGTINIATLYVYAAQPCENSKFVYSAITEQMSQIIVALTVDLEGVGVVTDSRLAPWDVALQYFTGDVCQVDGVLYKALQNSLGSDPAITPLDWEEIQFGSAGFLYTGAVWVDSFAGSDIDGVFGDVNKPFLTVTSAINSLPVASGRYAIICDGVSVNMGAGGVAFANKTVVILAHGATLTNSNNLLNNSSTSNLEVYCENFTNNAQVADNLNSIKFFCTGTFENNIGKVNAFGKGVTINADVLNINHPLTLVSQDINLFIREGVCTSRVGESNPVVVCHASGLFTSQHSECFRNLQPGSVMSGNYKVDSGAKLFYNGSSVLVRDFNIDATQSVFSFFATGFTLQHGRIVCERLQQNELDDATAQDVNFISTRVGSYPTEYAFTFNGDARVDDCTFEITTSTDYNGVYSIGGTLSISESHVILPLATNTAYGSDGTGAIVNLGDNDQHPRQVKTLDGTEIVKVLDATDGQYKETTTQGIADLGGGGGASVAYSADWNVANASTGSAVSGSAYAVLVIPEGDITVSQMETFVTAAAATTAYVGVYDQAGTTLLGEAAIDCNGTGLRSNTLVGGGTFNLTGGTPYWYVLLEGAGAANFASNSTLGNVLVAKSGFVSSTPTGLPASIAGFTVATSSMYIAAKA